MKKRFGFGILIMLLFSSFCVSAQGVNSENDGKWIDSSPEKEGVYGVDLVRAYEFLKNKKVKKSPVVAIIGSGIDVEHEALKGIIWKNKNEKANGKDNDKNGYIGDINGWNFLGGKSGDMLENLMREGDREFYRLKDKYADYLFDGKNYFKYVDGKRVDGVPENREEFEYYRNEVCVESPIASNYGGYTLSYLLRDYADVFDKEMRKLHPDKSDFTAEDLAKCWDRSAPKDSLREIALWHMGMYMTNFSKSNSWNEVHDLYKGDNFVNLARTSFEKTLVGVDVEARKRIVGDNYLDINDKIYGNSNLLTSNSATSTMMAGIIAGKRGIGGRNNPIVEQAQIMSLVVSGNTGEVFAKDIALSIRYAVDKGADVVIVSEPNSLSPEFQRVWIEEAIAYAERKNVLVVVPALELSMDVDKHAFYPNRFMKKEGEFSNLLVVSPSDKSGRPSLQSNYGVQSVDLYAPGVELLSSYLGDTYLVASGATLSAATVAGVVALINSYYPELTASQIRTIILENVTSRKGVEVEKQIIIKGQNAQDIFLFDELCLSGGIVNAYQTILAADKLVNQKK